MFNIDGGFESKSWYGLLIEPMTLHNPSYAQISETFSILFFFATRRQKSANSDDYFFIRLFYVIRNGLL